jgi:hypothetical protein
MNRILKNKNMAQRWAVLVLLMAVPALVWGQKKTSAPAPKAPASHASAPHASAPSHSTQTHSTSPTHSTTTHAATTGGTHTAAGGTHTAAGGTHTAAGGTHTAAGGTHTAAGGTHTAAGGTHTAAGGTHTAAGGTHTAAGGTHTAAGGTHTAAGGTHTAGSHAAPGRTVSLKGGGHASVRPNGSVRSIDRGGMHIEHGVHGGSRVVGEHNGARVVNEGRHGGYVQRSYMNRGGHAYYSRTFYRGGVYRVGIYRGYGWGGHNYYGYYPGVWYHPGFYGWGFHPWGASIAWGIGAWGWGGSPWWGFYGGWWNPYPVYAAPYYWLTDYLISQQLQAAYAARAEANADAVAADAAASGGDPAPAAAAAPVGLTPEVKEAIAQEVKAQLAAQQAEAAQGSGGSAPAPTNASNQPPPALDPAQRTFVVDTDVTVVANGQECALTGGDVITRLTDTPDADNNVTASVAASKKSDCASGQTVSVKVDDLQEMYNHFSEQLTNGMGEMAKKQGTNGMPKAPDTATQASDIPAPPPDKTAAKTLEDQQAAADQAETDVKQETAGGGGL